MVLPPGAMPPLNINSSSSATSGARLGSFSFGGLNVGTQSPSITNQIPVIMLGIVAVVGAIVFIAATKR